MQDHLLDLFPFRLYSGEHSSIQVSSYTMNSTQKSVLGMDKLKTPK
jgi:hypothetical protein